MSELTISRLGQVLEAPDTLDWRQALYLPLREVWSAATFCAVLDPTEGNGTDVPPLARGHGLDYALGISTVQDIVANARLQQPGVDADGLVEALRFYYVHDAFIVLPEAP